MDLNYALSILDQAAASAPLTRGMHGDVVLAMRTIRAALAPKQGSSGETPAPPAPAPAPQADGSSE